MIRYGTIALGATFAAALTSCGGNAGEQPQASPANEVAMSEAAPPAPAQPAPAASAPAATPVAASTLSATAGQGITSCNAEIGKAAAAGLARQCTSVSPATRPPCNALNSCAMIRAEIARSCSVIDDGTPVQGCATPPADGAAAAEVLRIYYAAINARDYSTAYELWDGNGERSGKSNASFAQGFAGTQTSTVRPGAPGRVEGAAGSSFVTIPVTVRARLTDGTDQRFTGSYVLRRANQPRSQGWHLYSASLKEAA